jgi:hypothetical protein
MLMRDAGAVTVLNKDNLLDRLYPAIVGEGMLSKSNSHLQ